MKQFKEILMTGLMLLALYAPAADQFRVDTTGPWSNVQKMRATTNTGAIMIAGFINTNFISVGAAKFLPIPRDGRFGFYIQSGATNALTVTNCNCLVEFVTFDFNNRTQVVDNTTITLTVPISGAVTAYDVLTNFPSLITTHPIYPGADAMRLRSCTNINSESIWLTNIVYLRP